MEAYFHNDPQTFPSEFLADGVKQLIEQQLPDARVINCLPTFQSTMDRMLREGILKVPEPHESHTERPIEVSHLEFVINSEIPALPSVNIPYLNIQQTKAEEQVKAGSLVS